LDGIAELGSLGIETSQRVKSHSQSRGSGMWAIFWRSLVLWPYALIVFICVRGLWLSRWMLPLYGATLLVLQEWSHATAVFALWLAALWLYRHFRLHRFLEAPPSLL
jgi:hypothetical protein